MSAKSDGYFERAFDLVVGHEGGFTDDRRDRGNWTGGKVGKGELRGTNYGISAATYPDLDIANLSLKEARSIYYEDYWLRCRCDLLEPGLAYATFDAAVNAGVGRAIRWLQRAVGTIADGVIGPATRRSILRAAPEPALREMIALRMFHYMTLDSIDDIYGLGWARRGIDVFAEAILLDRDPGN